MTDAGGPGRSPPALALRGIRKRFGSVQALRGADFVLRPGSVHALLGENGAGKSTLMHIAYGLVAPDAGSIEVAGHPAGIRSPRDARRLGLGMVHQHFTSVGRLSVAENIALWSGRRPAATGSGSRVLQRLREGLDANAEVETLSVSLRQRLEIVKALEAGARVLLLDEPTAVLAPAETEELLALARRFAREGGAVVLITHKLDEVFAAADRVTVLRHGEVTLDGELRSESPASLAAAMLGGHPAPRPRAHRPAGPRAERPERVRFDHVAFAPLGQRGPGLRDASFSVQAGELVGVVGVEGNGHRELMLGLAGLAPVRAGVLEVADPVALVPEDRSTEALIPSFTLAENVALAAGRAAPWVRGPWMDWAEVRRRTTELLATHEVRAPGPDVPVAQLSGGNQQKLVLGRALEGRPAVLIAENPTRGLDIAATAAVHHRLAQAAVDGVAVVVYSGDLDEILALDCDRVLVVARGRVREMRPDEGRAAIGRAMLGESA